MVYDASCILFEIVALFLIRPHHKTDETLEKITPYRPDDKEKVSVYSGC